MAGPRRSVRPRTILGAPKRSHSVERDLGQYVVHRTSVERRRIEGAAHPPEIGARVACSIDGELVQVRVRPTHDRLKDIVERAEVSGSRHLDLPPDLRKDPDQVDGEPEGVLRGRGHGRRMSKRRRAAQGALNSSEVGRHRTSHHRERRRMRDAIERALPGADSRQQLYVPDREAASDREPQGLLGGSHERRSREPPGRYRGFLDASSSLTQARRRATVAYCPFTVRPRATSAPYRRGS